jgi:hypothetical protein
LAVFLLRRECFPVPRKSTRRSRGLLFDNNWSFDRIIADIKILHEGYTADYFLNRMKPNALFPILFIQNVYIFFKSGTDIFYQIIAHVHFTEILSGYFLVFRFDWSIFVTQLLAKHMKEIIISVIIISQ